MRRFLTLFCLLCLAIPAGVSISGCTRNPDAKYCNGAGYGTKITDVTKIDLPPATGGISLAFGQTRQISSPSASTCKGDSASVPKFFYGTTNNELVDISPSGNMCAGTWNRNTGGGIADYTICTSPKSLPTTGGLPYATAYVTASAQSVVSNPVEIYVHTQVTSVSLVTESTSISLSAPKCYSQGQQAVLDGQACFANSSNQQVLLCAPSSVTSANSACPMPGVTPDIIASGTFNSSPVFTGSITGAEYVSGGSITGTEGQTCVVNGFNNGSSGATALVTLTGANAIASGTPMSITAGGTGATSAPTTAALSNGTATCSGSITVATGPIIGTAGQTCNLSNFNGSTGATATVTLTGANTIAAGSPLTITAGGLNAPNPPTTATLSNGTASCSGTATVSTTMTQVPNCTAALGSFNYSLGNSSIANITTNTNTNQVTLTAGQPGTTFITSSVAGSGSSAGFFSTCPPKSISLTLADHTTSGTITQGTTQNLTTVVTDTNVDLCPPTSSNPAGGCVITGFSLDYQSTNPIDISVGGGGSIVTSFPGQTSVYAICQPSSCNPAPTSEIGLFGTGLPVSSNPVKITTPGTASDYLWFAAPGQSQYIVPIDLLTNTVGSTIRLPYVPNSMVMDRLGDTIYFGSARELITFTTTSSTVAKEETSVPGVVLAVSPDNAALLINDQQRQIFYLYNVASGSSTSFAGLGNAAAWTPDEKTLYITDNAALNNAAEGISGHSDLLYIFNQNTGLTTHPLPPSPLTNSLPPGILPAGPLPPNPLPPNVALSSTMQTPALTIPSVGAYFRGSPTVAHTWCPSGIVGNYDSLSFYPQGLDPSTDNLVNVQSDALVATTDGQHILGASAASNVITLADIDVSIPSLNCLQPDAMANGDALLPLLLTNTVNTLQITPPGGAGNVAATAINQVVASPESNLAFITYTANANNSNALLPYYLPGSGGAAGTAGYVTLNGSANVIAPLAGAFTPDDKFFFVATAGDNMIHFISIPHVVSPASPPTDTQQISPNLPACSPITAGGVDAGCTYSGPSSVTVVPVTAIAIKPRATT